MSPLFSKGRTIKRKPVFVSSRSPVDMSRVATIILSGGEGKRLFPLTSTRCKPAISFGGRYRLIDIPLSNSIHSGCLKIFVVTQFLSSSLNNHICKTYHPGNYGSGFIELLSAEQKPTHKNWFQGTADAVRQNLEYFIETPADYFLILSGDQLYNINFQEMMRFARATRAELVVAALPIDENNAKRMGLLKINGKKAITDFIEKPQEKEILDQYRISDSPNTYLGSMGIYLFKRETLFRLLKEDSRDDFGKHLIPTQVAKGNTYAYTHQGYWEDIGTIDSYYHANIALTQPNAQFNWYDEGSPIFTTHHNLPGPRISCKQLSHSIICEGAIVEANHVENSILGARTVVKKGSVIKDSYIIGNDNYHARIKNAHLPETHSIGEQCVISRAIIDKHVSIGNRVQLINKDNLTHYDGKDVYIRDGIIIVTHGASIPDDFSL